MTDDLSHELEYCQKVIETVEKEEIIREYPNVKEKLNYFKGNRRRSPRHLQFSQDPDARIGHKTKTSGFFFLFGYKNTYCDE